MTWLGLKIKPATNLILQGIAITQQALPCEKQEIEEKKQDCNILTQ